MRWHSLVEVREIRCAMARGLTVQHSTHPDANRRDPEGVNGWTTVTGGPLFKAQIAEGLATGKYRVEVQGDEE